jgi:hypothetical protein
VFKSLQQKIIYEQAAEKSSSSRHSYTNLTRGAEAGEAKKEGGRERRGVIE